MTGAGRGGLVGAIAPPPSSCCAPTTSSVRTKSVHAMDQHGKHEGTQQALARPPFLRDDGQHA
eukprot:10859377-Alexandrium_andersonii.AAC.1